MKSPGFNGRIAKKEKTGSRVTLSYLCKRRAINKLRRVYGVSLAWNVGSDVLAIEVAKVLRVESPKAVSDGAKMVSSFVSSEARFMADDPIIAALKARHPFVPLRITPEMERALARTREAREIGRESIGV